MAGPECLEALPMRHIGRRGLGLRRSRNAPSAERADKPYRGQRMIQAWLVDGTSGAAARLLAALRAGEGTRIEAELARAAEVCRAPLDDSWAAERTEVLAAVVRELCQAAGVRGEVNLDSHACLLAHLAGM
jgi:hypothetical protein